MKVVAFNGSARKDGNTALLVREVFQKLEQEGFDTVVVVDADAAANMLESLNPDLVILDTISPEQDSLEILDRMRKHSKVPIIMLSAEYEADTMQKALSHGADDYIRVPFGIRPFIARIRAKLRRLPHSENF